MLTTYFKQLIYKPSVINGFYILEDASDQYYVCAYIDRNRGKKEIIDILVKLPSYRNLSAADFDFHHIVEEQHLADISFSTQQYFNYENMPTVMIHKGEHKRYNAILHTKETRLLYLRDQKQSISQYSSSDMRKQAAVKLFNDNNRKEINSRITVLKEIYGAVYEGNIILKTISNNIFNEYLHQLKLKEILVKK